MHIYIVCVIQIYYVCLCIIYIISHITTRLYPPWKSDHCLWGFTLQAAPPTIRVDSKLIHDLFMIHQQTKQIYTFVTGRTLAIYYWGASPDVVAEYPTNHEEKKLPLFPWHLTVNFYIQTDYAIPINQFLISSYIPMLHSYIPMISPTFSSFSTPEMVSFSQSSSATRSRHARLLFKIVNLTCVWFNKQYREYIYIYNGNMIPTTMGKCWMDNDGI